ncbi:GNAT family N-acetyltransferase [Tardiphaga sp. 862_B3_N4_1]|uniref:GNAT family N-acetyltransferase n=1 Tax=Tardiphaga sp. 862_B3_N4_1 TaxID=3240764 RepID=UPI003F239B73
MQVRLLAASRLDIDRHVELLRSAFGQSAWATQIGDTFTPEFYRWKYFSPAGEAVIASLSGEEGLVASVSAFPTRLHTPSGEQRGWQIGDIATVSSARRRGLYRKCLDALVERLGCDIMVCFPNALSRNGIEACGFGVAAEVRTFIHPLIGPGRSAPPDHANWDSLESCHFGEPARAGGYSFVRDREFLRWRYRDNPACAYELASRQGAYCVSRPFVAFGRRVNVVMEVGASNDRILRHLMCDVERTAAKQERVANFVMTSRPMPWRMRMRYLPVPHWLLPKRQLLLVRMPGGHPLQGNWDVQIGDWDGL